MEEYHNWAIEEHQKQRAIARLSYAILQSTNKHKLETEVIQYMKEGWTVSGGISVTMIRVGEYVYCQAMVRL